MIGTRAWQWLRQVGTSQELRDYFIWKGADRWDYGLYWATYGGNIHMCAFFLEKGATWYRGGVIGADRGGHTSLRTYFSDKLTTENNLANSLNTFG
jgi:hypothetical protein